LRKERQEGSSMFWRSMPVSNLMTHGVKLTFGLLVIPVICSVLVIASDLMFWLVNLATDDAIPLLMHQRSLLFVLTHWLNYLGLMLLVALALLPLACITLLISQLVNSPILVMFIAVYALKWLSLGLFGSDAIGDFFHQTLALPLNILTDSSLSQVVAQISVANALIYIALGVVSFILSLKCYQTDEVSWRTLLQR
jgi:ABC-2 type transport system permease protein